MAAGVALGHKFDGSDDVVVSFVGEGGVNQGTFHESLNLASIWTLPLIVVIENNIYTEYCHYRTVTAVEQLSDRATSYEMPGVTVDGQDVIAVLQSTTEAVVRARAGAGPTLIEARTYRFRGHHEGEEQILGRNIYRTVEEIEEAQRARDPITLLKTQLLDRGVDEGFLETVEEEISQQLEEAIEFAETSELPSPLEANEFVYTDQPRRQNYREIRKVPARHEPLFDRATHLVGQLEREIAPFVAQVADGPFVRAVLEG